MRRKEKKRRKKKLILLLVPPALFLTGSIIVGLGIFFPRVAEIFNPQDEVKSAYINRPSLSQVEGILQEKKINYTSVASIDEGESFSITLERGTIVKVSATRDIAKQVDTLHKLIRRLTIDNKQAKEIDLRLTRPIVKY